MMRKATAVKLIPKDPADKINVDGEVLDGKGIELRVLPRVLRCFIADGVAKSEAPEDGAASSESNEYIF
jgi:diacylglycerol kinase family enzyme